MKRRPKERGFALVTVILLLSILAFITAAITSEARRRIASINNNSEFLVARNLAEAAIALAKLDLSRPDEEARYPRDGAPHLLRLEGGEASFQIQDERGKLDLNNSRPGFLATLISSVSRREDPTFAAVSLADQIKASAPTNLSDIRRVPGVTANLFVALAPHVTVYGDSQINIDEATPAVLASLPGVTPGLVEQVLRARRTGSPRPPLGPAEEYATARHGPTYTLVAVGRAASGIEVRITEVVIAGVGDTPNHPRNVRVIERR